MTGFLRRNAWFILYILPFLWLAGCGGSTGASPSHGLAVPPLDTDAGTVATSPSPPLPVPPPSDDPTGGATPDPTGDGGTSAPLPDPVQVACSAAYEACTVMCGKRFAACNEDQCLIAICGPEQTTCLAKKSLPSHTTLRRNWCAAHDTNQGQCGVELCGSHPAESCQDATVECGNDCAEKYPATELAKQETCDFRCDAREDRCLDRQ